MAEASSSSATIHCIRMHPYGERYHSPMATLAGLLLRVRSSRSSKVPQAASSLAVPPEPPAEQEYKQSSERRDRLVHTALPVVLTSWPPCPLVRVTLS